MKFEEVIHVRSLTREEDILTKVVVAEIEKKTAAAVLKETSLLLPMEKYGLDHLKRIRKTTSENGSNLLEVVVCPESFFESAESQRLVHFWISTRCVSVCKIAPETRDEFEAWGRYWPMTFRTTELDRRRAKEAEQDFTGSASSSNAMLESIPDRSHFMSLVAQDAADVTALLSGGSGCNARGGAVLVNPENGQVVATSCQSIRHKISALENQKAVVCEAGVCVNPGACNSSSAATNRQADTTQRHIDIIGANPLVTPVLLCIDEVSWQLSTRDQVAEGGVQLSSIGSSTGSCTAQSDSEEREECQAVCKVESVMGHQHLPTDQYLCTGLDLYCSYEPDLYSSMALVHSRIRQVTYQTSCCLSTTSDSTGKCSNSTFLGYNGCLGSYMCLHANPRLNHRFRVFRAIT